MFKKHSSNTDIEFVMDRATYIHEQMLKLYNQLHLTTYVPKEKLLTSRFNNSQSYNLMFHELNTIFRELKSNNQQKKLKKKLEETERRINLLDLMFMKIKNIEIISTEEIADEHKMENIGPQLEGELLSIYLSIKAEILITELKTVDGRTAAYHELITHFLKDIETNHFIIDELQIEITKHLAVLSEQLCHNVNETEFWNGVSSSIAKHYILPVFLEELMKQQ